MTSESELVEVAMTTMSQQEEDAHQSGMYGCQEFSLLQGGQQGDSGSRNLQLPCAHFNNFTV